MKELSIQNSPIPAIVDDEDYDRCKQEGSWSINGDGAIGRQGKVYWSKGYRTGQWISLAAFVMNRIGVLFDHADRDKRNNRKYNLREATQQQNSFNIGKKGTGNSSQYKGVSWNAKHKRWYVFIRFNGKRTYLGNFTNEIEAAHAYDKAAIDLFKEFAYLNNV